MVIRSATAADLPAIVALERQAASAAHWSHEQYEGMLESPERQVLVMEDQSVVRGFLVGRKVDTEWEIENIAITGLAQRRGLATRLLGDFLSQARSLGARSAFLEVRESNRAARRLYEKAGFVDSGRRKRYYRDPEEDAVLYRLDFA